MANTLTGTYTALSEWGALQVTLTPTAAVTAGAKWQVDGGAWNDSAATVDGLSVGAHVIAYRAATGYTSPTSETTSILADQTRVISRAYTATPTATTTARPANRLANLPYPFGFKALDEVRDYLIKLRSKLAGTDFTVTMNDIGTGLPEPTLGAIIYGDVTPKWVTLPGQITTTRNFLTQTGIGAVSAPPKWEVFPLPLDGVLYEMLTCDAETLEWGWPGTENTFIGRDAALAVTTGSYNTLGGYGSGQYLIAEKGNTFYGSRAGYYGGDTGGTTETVEATSYDLKYTDAETYDPRPQPICSWGGMIVTMGGGATTGVYTIKGSYDGATWDTLLSHTAAVGINSNPTRMASFKGSLWYSIYANTTGSGGDGIVQQWDGTTRTGHLPSPPQGNGLIDQLFVYGDKLYAISDVTAYVGANSQRVVSYTDGSAPGGVPSSWTTISNYNGDAYYNYNDTYAPVEYYKKDTNHLFPFEDHLYFVCSRWDGSTQWETKILQFDGTTSAFTTVATITPDEVYLHPCGIAELGGTVYLFLSEFGDNGAPVGGDGRLVVYTSTDMLTWTLWKDFGDNYGVVCGTKYFNHRIFVSIQSDYIGGGVDTEVYYLNTAAKTLTKEATLATTIGPGGDLIEFDGYLWQSQQLNIYRRTATTWLQTLYPDTALGSYNTFIGGGSGKSNVTGRFNSCLGYFSDVMSPDLDNATAIGFRAAVSESNTLVLGGVGAYAVNVCIGRTSGSERFDMVGSAKVSGRLISTIATGTYPVVVSSTTMCVNLNADMLDGYHAAAFLGLPVLADPNADRIVFWDDSAGALKWLACGDSIAITTTTLDTIQDIRTTAGPTFDHLHLTTDLPVSEGGTGASTFALNGILYGNAANAIGVTAIGSEGQFLRVGANPYVPAWSTLTLPNTGTAYRLPVFSSANVMTELAAVGATGQYLAGNTGTIPSWANISAFEPALGNPGTTGWVLSSTDGGVRSWIAPGGGGSGDSNTISVAQAVHGFSAGDVVKCTGANTYAKAQADSAVNSEVAGIVSVVVDGGNFTLLMGGYWASASVPAVAAGTVMYLSPSSAGAMTSTAPTTIGQISKPVGIIVENAAKMLIFNWRGVLINYGAGGEGLTLDDLTDVNSPTPVDQDVLTWDDGAGEWIPQVASSGGTTYPDPYLCLLLHFNGADDAIVFPDSSKFNVPITRVGDAHIHQGEKILGNASLYLDGSDYLTFPSSVMFAFGTGDFTIDFWVNAASMNDKVLISGRQAIGTMIITTGGSGGSTVGVLRYVGSSTIVSTTVITDGTWHHCAIVRCAGAIALYVDGVSEATGTDTTNYTATTGTWYIGENEIYGSGYLTGYLDEFRISNMARWKSGFTSPSVEYASDILWGG